MGLLKLQTVNLYCLFSHPKSSSMNLLFSNRYHSGGFNTGMFILRAGLGILMLDSGIMTIQNFDVLSGKFINFMGMGSSVSLGLVVFAEVVCAGLIVLGLFTRLACIPLIITLAVALGKAHDWDIFKTGEIATLFLIGYTAILFCGPGKFSADAAIRK